MAFRIEIDGGDDDDVDGTHDEGGEDAPECPDRDEMVDHIISGRGEAVYVAGLTGGDGFVSAIAETDYERKVAASLIEAATTGLAIYVSGPAAKRERFRVPGRASRMANAELKERVNEDIFNRLGEVEYPRIPVPTRMDPDTRVVHAAHSLMSGGKRDGPF